MKTLLIALLTPFMLLTAGAGVALACGDHDDADYLLEAELIADAEVFPSAGELATEALNLAQLDHPGTRVTVTSWFLPGPEPAPNLFVSRHAGVRVTLLSVDVRPADAPPGPAIAAVADAR